MWARRRRSTGSVKHRKNSCKIWTRQRSSNSVRILRNFSAPIAIPLRNSGLFVAVAGEIWSTSEVLQHFKRTSTISIRSLATSLRRIPVEDQSMANLRDKLCSSRRKTCSEKQRRRIDQIALEKHDFSATKAERIRTSKQFSRLMLRDLNNLENNAQMMPQQKETVSDCKTRVWQKQSSSTHQFIRANKCVKIRISNLKDVKIMITLLIGKQDENGTKSSRETCRILRLRRPHHGRIPHCKIGIHGGGILQNLTKSSEWLFFSLFQQSMQFWMI